jgi:hypothetical protein
LGEVGDEVLVVRMQTVRCKVGWIQIVLEIVVRRKDSEVR